MVFWEVFNMNLPKCSFIISVYKDTESLGFILESLERQTILPDEVIISEDGESIEMAEYFPKAQKQFSKLNLRHLTQEDINWRKNRALNRAIVASKYEYLIFIDGDCVPFDSFVENHLIQAKVGIVLAGKRVELGANVTTQIRERKIDIAHFTNHYMSYLLQLISDKTRHLEDILYINPTSFLWKFIKPKVNFLIGCNWSCFKEDILKINGFDEDYTLPSIGEDVDVGQRFRGLGIELESCRYRANIIHLYHKKRFDNTQGKINSVIFERMLEEKLYVCKNGINKK